MFDTYKVPINLRSLEFKENGHNHDRIWVNRPLTTDAVLLAAAKVLGLVHERIYQSMCEAVLPENRKLLLELCYEQIFWNIKRADIAAKKRKRKQNFDPAVLHVKFTQSNNDMISKRSKPNHLNFINMPDADRDKLMACSSSNRKLMPAENKSDTCSLDIEQNNQECSYMDYDIFHNKSNSVEVTGCTTLTHSALNDNIYHDIAEEISDSAFIDPFSGKPCNCSGCRMA